LTLSVLGLVLVAAVIHALWNTWLKASGDRLVALTTLAVGWAIVGLSSLPFVGTPRQEAWPYLLVSALVHTVYSLTLIRAYGLGNLSVTYPIARGTGPLVVVVVSTAYLGDSLGVMGFLAVALIVIGVGWLGVPRSNQGYAGLLFSLLTGAFIGTYTLLDGFGGRLGESPHAYVAWLLLLTAFPIFVVSGSVHGARFASLVRPIWLKGVSAGVLSAAAYWVVVWAMSVAPMGLVAAVRESSVVFAALFGSMLLRERVRWAAVVVVFGGIVFTGLA